MIGNSLSGTLPGGGGVMAAHFGGQIRIYNAFLWLNNAETQGYIGFAQQSHNDQPASLLLGRQRDRSKTASRMTMPTRLPSRSEPAPN